MISQLTTDIRWKGFKFQVEGFTKLQLNLFQERVMANSPGQEEEVNLAEEEEKEEQDPLVKKRKMEVATDNLWRIRL